MEPGSDIGWAVWMMREGERVRRSGWNGKGMFLFLVPGSHFKVNRAPLLGIYPEGTRSRSGKLHKGHTGVARIALRANAPIVPVGIIGAVGCSRPTPSSRGRSWRC